jgi:hypothetical protein
VDLKRDIFIVSSSGSEKEKGSGSDGLHCFVLFSSDFWIELHYIHSACSIRGCGFDKNICLILGLHLYFFNEFVIAYLKIKIIIIIIIKCRAERSFVLKRSFLFF